MEIKIKNAADELIKRILAKKNPSVVGLDPNIKDIPMCIKQKYIEKTNSFEAVRDVFIEFNKRIIDAVYDIVPAVKPQIAYYEAYGKYGIEAFEETVKYAKERDLIVIADAKRNDIGSTAKAYSDAFIGRVETIGEESKSAYDVDCITVNPYLGSDGIEPFLNASKNYGKGIFVLVKTSNPSSGELQDLILKDGRTVYQTIAEYVAKVGEDIIGKYGYSSIGAVVGATYPIQANELRRIMKKNIFLVPGFGAQGATAKDIVNCFNEEGLGAIVNSARGIIFAYKNGKYSSKFKSEQFDEAARQAAIDMRDDIVNELLSKNKCMY